MSSLADNWFIKERKPEARFQSDSYQTFLLHLLSQVPGKVILIQDGARYHTSKATRTFFEQHKERLIVYQLPSYSPDYNPIEYLWKKVKTAATHNRYYDEFLKLVSSVDEALKVLTTQVDEILRLMGVYAKHLTDYSPHIIFQIIILTTIVQQLIQQTLSEIAETAL